MNINSDYQISNLFLSNLGEDEADFIPLISDENEKFLEDGLNELPILPLRNTVLFPGVILPIGIGREKSIRLINEAYEGNRLIGAVAQKDSADDEPTFDTLYSVGTLVQIVKILKMPDSSTSVLIQAKKRFRMLRAINEEPYLRAEVEMLDDILPQKNEQEFEAVVASVKDLSTRIIQLSSHIPQEAAFAVRNIENAPFLINFVCSSTDIEVPVKQHLLEIDELKERAMQLLESLAKEVKKLEIKGNIQDKVLTEIDQQQREYFLHQQLKQIRNELGVDSNDREKEDLKERAKSKKWSEEVGKLFAKEVEKLEHIHPSSPEYSNHITYLQTLLELPWNEYTKDNFDLKRAKKILEKDHYGLDNVKDRILEHLAVLKLKGDLKAPIICLVGPPGVGKTSLGKSIATALERKYVRMALGGLHDEAEIRGHRKTYIGAMPGRIIQNLKKVKTSNPVFILDEIDKVGNDFRGDPSFALLEVLDPEQNNSFYDNYLEIEYDLSKIMFIATANSLTPIKPALKDRMEIIHVSGYILEEKAEIAKRHLIPKQLENHGVKKEQLKFPKKIIEAIIEEYTRESGVRQLDKKIAKVVRFIAKKIGMEEEYNETLSHEDLFEILGSPEYIKDKYEGNDFYGVVTGLAWTVVGGDILFVETSLSKGKGVLTLTGNLGDVMKESAVIALEYLKSHAEELKIDADLFDNFNIHIHIPEGAIPKDGPSAGVTMITSLASAFAKRKVRKNLAMTGEITLRGKVLPVGGIKEKILAAKRAGITDIILSKDNEKDIKQIKEIYIAGLTFHYVNTIIDVINLALLEE